MAGDKQPPVDQGPGRQEIRTGPPPVVRKPIPIPDLPKKK